MQALNLSAEASMIDSIGNVKGSTSYVERQGAASPGFNGPPSYNIWLQ